MNTKMTSLRWSPIAKLATAATLCGLAAASFAQTATPTATSPAQEAVAASAQTATPTPSDNIRFGYAIHQSVDFGGHVVSQSGSGAMYDTLVNIKPGPRVLDYSLTLLAVDPAKAHIFDRVTTDSFGYGGDPNSVSTLNISKGKLYEFRGTFRRDRQYSDYNLLSNPLIPPTSTVYAPWLDSIHLFNTVRRMTDLSLTIEPLSKVSLRLDYNHSIMQGPSYSSVHEGGDALLLQLLRNSSDTFSGGLDWKVNHKSTLSYDQFVMHYKGDTRWQLAGLNYQLSNGTPVSLGVDLSSAWNAPCAAPFTPTGAVSPTCSSYLAYTRSAPTRTLAPTEQIRFQTTSIPRLALNGRFLYSATTSNLNNYNEFFNGLVSRLALRQSNITGSAHIRRINVNGDIGATWTITPRLMATNIYNFSDFRMPGTLSLLETDYAGTNTLVAPGAVTTLATTDDEFLNQKTHTNTSMLIWDVTSRAQINGGFRYRSRVINNAAGDSIPIHEDWGFLGATLRPGPNLRINFNLESMYADNSFTRISPRQMQHYIVRTTYKPRTWLTLAGTVNIRESRNNVDTVNHLTHNRDFSFGANIGWSEKWSLDFNYSYNDIYSSTLECYASTPAPPSATPAPDVCVAAGTPYASTGFYKAPTQFVSGALTLKPVKKARVNLGFRASNTSGSTETFNNRQVPGSLQSQFYTPFANANFDIARNWSWKGDYNFYGYGENSPVGPTAPRSFHGNVCTLAVHYSF